MQHLAEEILPVLMVTMAAASDLLIQNNIMEPNGILDNHDLLLWCIMGSLFGGYLASAIFSPSDATRKSFAAKLTTSSVASICFTPMAMLYFNIKLVPEWVLGTSAAIAIVGVGVIKGVAAVWTKWLINKFSPSESVNQNQKPN